ncbi:unnamed protein product [Soboliphyme baturini]|uniref:FGFR1 oncogene partner 2 homolog n=1 Tax=Soboliphyme baturini TaxID=241478 RepID=A0A183IGN7_9BILA|nr:unnamed protein product [Soboliphyme baturini]
MALNISQIIADVRSTVVRLHENDKLTDTLLASLQSVNERINCMRESFQYRDDVFEFNEAVPNSARSVIVQSLQQENRQMRLLEEENKQLKIVLKEHQTALDLIMSRYRQQVLELIRLNKLHEVAKEYKTMLYDGNSRLVHFARIVNEIITHGEEQSELDIEEITRLQVENKTLRQLLLGARNSERGCIDSGTCICKKTLSNIHNGSSSPAALSKRDDKAEVEPAELSKMRTETFEPNHCPSDPLPTGSPQSEACNRNLMKLKVANGGAKGSSGTSTSADPSASNLNAVSPKMVATTKVPVVKKPHLSTGPKAPSCVISRRRSAGTYVAKDVRPSVTNGILLAKKKVTSDDSSAAAKAKTAPKTRFSFGGRISLATTPKTHNVVKAEK